MLDRWKQMPEEVGWWSMGEDDLRKDMKRDGRWKKMIRGKIWKETDDGRLATPFTILVPNFRSLSTSRAASQYVSDRIPVRHLSINKPIRQHSIMRKSTYESNTAIPWSACNNGPFHLYLNSSHKGQGRQETVESPSRPTVVYTD